MNSVPIGLLDERLGRPHQVALGSIQVSEDRFQVRRFDSNNLAQRTIQKMESMKMIKHLHDVVITGGTLDPLIVWRDPSKADGLVLIEGHHRQAAYLEAGLKARDPVWVQLLEVTTEKDARKFAYEINARVHMNMTNSERQNEAWLAILCEEAQGSYRKIANEYGIGKSSVDRMFKAKAETLERIAETTGGFFEVDPQHIRSQAPLWKELAAWREQGETKGDPEDLDQKRIDSIIVTLTTKFHSLMTTQPDLLLKAVSEFHLQVTGRPVSFQVESWSDEEDLEEV